MNTDLSRLIAEGHAPNPADAFLTRRQWLARTGMGMGALSLASVLGRDVFAPSAQAAPVGPLTERAPHFAPTAKRVIHIFSQGAPSQLDTWDPKPALVQHDGKELPDLKGVAFASPFKFTPRGKSGIPVSEVFPHIGESVDEMCVIRSMFTDIPAHETATVFMNTGNLRLSRPSLGSWAVYGLGTVNQNMPGFISLRPGGFPPGGTQNWQSAFLPGVYQGTSVNTQAATVQQMIQNIHNQYSSKDEQRRQLDLIHKLNDLHSQNLQKDAQLEARIEAFEIAFKMQAEASDAFDYSKEAAATQAAYGSTAQGKTCLIARRLVERGVRFVQIWDGGWDHHQDIEGRLTASARKIDQPVGALLKDLKERGLLKDTLVIWGGEFGRKPIRDRNGGGDNAGRDHNNKAFSTWLAGGGVRGGTIWGATDEFGNAAVENKVHVHDLHATILHTLGFDHTKLTFRHNGRDFRLTDVKGNVVKGVLA